MVASFCEFCLLPESARMAGGFVLTKMVARQVQAHLRTFGHIQARGAKVVFLFGCQ